MGLVLAVDGEILDAGVQLRHLNETFALTEDGKHTAGTRHSAGVAFAECLMDDQISGGVIVASESGDVTLILPDGSASLQAWRCKPEFGEHCNHKRNDVSDANLQFPPGEFDSRLQRINHN